MLGGEVNFQYEFIEIGMKLKILKLGIKFGFNKKSTSITMNVWRSFFFYSSKQVAKYDSKI